MLSLNSQSVIGVIASLHFLWIDEYWLMTFCIRKEELRDLQTCSSVDLIIEMAHKSTNTCRFSDIGGEPLRRLPPIRGFENEELVLFEEATEPLIGVVPEIEHMLDIVHDHNTKPKNGLSKDKSSSITLHSMEWNPREKSFYCILNETLWGKRREILLPPWLKFLRLFFTSLSELPSANHRIIYRGVKIDLRDQYKINERIVWWGFSSCTKTLDVLENEEFVGKSGIRTVFTIESDTGKHIGEHSFYSEEDEILLLPGREFEIVSSVDMGNQLTMIHLKEVQPWFPNLPPLPSSNPPVSASTVSIPSATTVTAKVTASSVQAKPIPQPKPFIQPVQVSYRNKNLTDNDIPGVIKEAFQQKQCTILNLGWNNITDEGAAFLSKALKHNEVSLCVETVWTSRWNQPLIQLIGKRKQNWQIKRRSNSIVRSVNTSVWNKFTDWTSICLSELILLSLSTLHNENAPYHNILLFSSNNFSLSCWSDINPNCRRDVRCLKTNFVSLSNISSSFNE